MTRAAPERRPMLAPVVDARVRRERRGAALRRVGELLLAVGAVVLLFAAWQTVGTGWVTGAAQSAASAELDRSWLAPPGSDPPAVGEPALRMYVPAFGTGWVRTVLEGVEDDVLADGPGHYPGTAAPGEAGNVAIAGHRVSHGAPFDGAGDLRSCDAIVLETRTSWFVYRVLPFAGEGAGEGADRGRTAATRAACRGVVPLPGVDGREIVAPTATEVVAPVPHRPGVAPQAALLTITTCHPRFSARQRLVLHAVLVTTHPKTGHRADWRPVELAES